MKLIVGLGNPGAQYTATRHNLGFIIIDQLAANFGATWRPEAKFESTVADTQLPAEAGAPDERLILAKPQTFMNNSGQAVQKLMQFYKIAPAEVWVISDDLDTPFGRLKIRRGGSAGGHQGLHSVMHHIGPDFVRARAGISMNDRAVEPSESYVLNAFNPDEREQLPAFITEIAAVIIQQLAEPSPQENTFELIK